MEVALSLSQYALELPKASRERYISKVKDVGLASDPYSLKDWIREPEHVPNLAWSDVLMYMVATPSPYTKQTIKVMYFTYKGSLKFVIKCHIGLERYVRFRVFCCTELGGCMTYFFTCLLRRPAQVQDI